MSSSYSSITISSTLSCLDLTLVRYSVVRSWSIRKRVISGFVDGSTLFRKWGITSSCIACVIVPLDVVIVVVLTGLIVYSRYFGVKNFRCGKLSLDDLCSGFSSLSEEGNGRQNLSSLHRGGSTVLLSVWTDVECLVVSAVPRKNYTGAFFNAEWRGAEQLVLLLRRNHYALPITHFHISFHKIFFFALCLRISLACEFLSSSISMTYSSLISLERGSEIGI